MATQRENQDIKTLQSDVNGLKTDVAVMKTDLGYIKGTADKMESFIDANRSGIKTASLLDNKITTGVLGAIIAAGLIILAKGGNFL